MPTHLIPDISWGGGMGVVFLPLCRAAVGVFYCPNRLAYMVEGLTLPRRCSRRILQHLTSRLGLLCRRFYPSAEMQSVYFTAPPRANRAKKQRNQTKSSPSHNKFQLLKILTHKFIISTAENYKQVFQQTRTTPRKTSSFIWYCLCAKLV